LRVGNDGPGPPIFIFQHGRRLIFGQKNKGLLIADVGTPFFTIRAVAGHINGNQRGVQIRMGVNLDAGSCPAAFRAGLYQAADHLARFTARAALRAEKKIVCFFGIHLCSLLSVLVIMFLTRFFQAFYKIFMKIDEQKRFSSFLIFGYFYGKY
jgi:hypothetical protein